LFIVLGKKVIIQKGFDVQKACHLIRKYSVEVVTVVSLMLYKQDLRYSANTLGKKIKGAKLKVLNENRNEVKVGEVGQFCIKTR